jgi:lysophospholipase L1-like esterase
VSIEREYRFKCFDGHRSEVLEFFPDGLHPSEKGYAIIARLAEQEIRAAIKRKR